MNVRYKGATQEPVSIASKSWKNKNFFWLLALAGSGLQK